MYWGFRADRGHTCRLASSPTYIDVWEEHYQFLLFISVHIQVPRFVYP